MLLLVINLWVRGAQWQGALSQSWIKFFKLHRSDNFHWCLHSDDSKYCNRTLNLWSGLGGWILNAQCHITRSDNHGRPSRLLTISQGHSSAFEAPVSLETLHTIHCPIVLSLHRLDIFTTWVEKTFWLPKFKAKFQVGSLFLSMTILHTTVYMWSQKHRFHN